MTRLSLRGILLVGLAVLVPGFVRAADDLRFGMALVDKFGFDDLAVKHFTRLRNDQNKYRRLTGILGLGVVRKKLADRAKAERKAAEAERLYAEARKLIEEFNTEAPRDHPDRGDALAVLGKIAKDHVKQLIDRIKDPATPDDVRRRLREEAKAIFAKLTEPLKTEAKKAREAYVKIDLGPEPGSSTGGEGRGGENRLRNRLLEKAVLAMQRYFNTALDQAELYRRGSREGEKFLNELIGAMGEARSFYDEDYPGVVAWLNYSLGRAHFLAGKIDQATGSFDEVLQFTTEELPPAARQWMENLKIYAFYTKAKAQFEAKKWEAAIATVDAMFSPPDGMPWAASTNQGNAARLIKAESLFRKGQPDYQGAIREATKVIRQNKQPWPNNASRIIAQIQEEMRKTDQELAQSPETLHRGALGEHQLALQESDPARRAERLENAVVGLEKTVAACRADGVKYRIRLEHEPAAWFELGSLYSKMGLWYEAGFAFEAVLRYFAKDVVGRALEASFPDCKDMLAKVRQGIKDDTIKPEEPGQELNEYALLFDEAMKESSLKKILEGLDTRLTKSAHNLMVAARRRHRESRSDFDAARLKQAIRILIMVSPGKRRMLDFHLALLARQEAEGLLDAKKPEEAIGKWEEACRGFLSSAVTQPSIRELAYHLSGKAYYQAMTEADTLGSRAPKLAARAKEFGGKALDAFARFEKEALPRLGRDIPSEEKKRKKRLGEVAIARPAIHLSLGQTAEAIKAADEFLAKAGDLLAEEDEEKRKEFIAGALWTRMSALRELALASVGTEREEEGLSRLVKTAEAMKTDAEGFYGAALSMVAATYNDAAGRLAEAAKKKEGAEQAALVKRAGKYRLKWGDYMKTLIELRPKEKRDLGFYLSIARVFFDQEAYDGARDLYKDRILAQFNPSGDIEKSQIPEELFKQAARRVVFADETKTRKVREDIESLKELLFGEPKSERLDHRYKKVKPPKKRDWSKAVRTIDRLLEESPKLQCKDDLKRVRKELVFRLQMLSVRLNLADCNLALAKKRLASKPEKARPLLEEAVEYLKTVRGYYWRDNALRFLQAQAVEDLGRLEDARELYIEASTNSPPDSATHYRAQIAFSKVAFRMGEREKDKNLAEKHFRNASNFPRVITMTYPEQMWKEHWPDAKDFVAKCEQAIEGLGRKVVMWKPDIKDDKRTEYDVSADDQDLYQQFRVVDARIRNKVVEESERQTLYKEAMELHLSRLPDKQLEGIDGYLVSGELTKAEAKRLRKERLARLLYQSPFEDVRLRNGSVKLGLLESPDEGVPVRLLSERAKRTAVKLRLLTKDGEKKPLSEIDESLLKKRYGTGEEAPEGAPPPGGEAPEPAGEPEPGEPEPKEAPEPEGGTDAGGAPEAVPGEVTK